MSTPLVHVLVVNWNGREHLEACFASLLANAYPNVCYVLIDNGSTDGSVAFVRECFGHDPRVEIVECGANLGWSGGNNVGMRRALDAGADYVFLLNNDTALAPDAIARLVEAAEAEPRAGAWAPKMVLFDAPDLLNSVGIACSIIGAGWDIGLGRLDGPGWSERRRVAGACGGAAFFRTEALRKAGLLPEDFEIYLDDLDLCLRIWNAGYEILSCPDAVVRHKFSATMGAEARLRRKYYLNTRNRFLLILRNFPVSAFALVTAALCVGEARAVGRAVLNREYWRVGVHARAWVDAAAYLPKAVAERQARRRAGIGACRFWELVRCRPLFFPGVELPERGWYPERTVADVKLQPISARAVIEAGPGRLRITSVNPYPHLGLVQVDVLAGGRVLATLQTTAHEERIVEAPGGTIEFRARRVFHADHTGERADFGGWIRIDPL